MKDLVWVEKILRFAQDDVLGSSGIFVKFGGQTVELPELIHKKAASKSSTRITRILSESFVRRLCLLAPSSERMCERPRDVSFVYNK